MGSKVIKRTLISCRVNFIKFPSLYENVLKIYVLLFWLKLIRKFYFKIDVVTAVVVRHPSDITPH